MGLHDGIYICLVSLISRHAVCGLTRQNASSSHLFLLGRREDLARIQSKGRSIRSITCWIILNSIRVLGWLETRAVAKQGPWEGLLACFHCHSVSLSLSKQQIAVIRDY